MMPGLIAGDAGTGLTSHDAAARPSQGAHGKPQLEPA